MYLLLAFLAVPLIEIALFIQVGGLIGLWPTLLIVVVTAVLGAGMVRSQGALAMAELRRSLNDLSDPSEPLAHGAMILLSGALLLTPGFFTDAVGFALLVPGVRRWVTRQVRARVKVERFEMGGRAPRPDAPRDRVIDGEFEDVTHAEAPRPTHTPPRGSSGWTRH